MNADDALEAGQRRSPQHVPVLTREVLEYVGGLQDGVVVDCTLGLGGHASTLLGRCPAVQLIGLDVDPGNLEFGRRRLAEYGDRVRLFRENFANLGQVLAEAGVSRVAGILADLGLSSNQISDPGMGLSFDVDGPLDMRLDNRQTTTAADLVNSLGEGELSDLLYFQCQERHSRRIAKRICQARRQGRLNSTVMLARLVAAAVGEDPASHRGRIHPATRTFMALRMAVNQELPSLERLLAQAPDVLRSGGRFAVISFHSGEDRLVKEDFRSRAALGVYRILTRKPVTAGPAEQSTNPRSRSAKLRVAERL